MEDLIAGLQAAPLWAQIGIAFFAFTFVVMLVQPTLTKRKFRRHFDRIAEGLGRPPSRDHDWPFKVSADVDARTFELRYDLRQTSGRGSSYRGPTGHLLTTATRLAGTRWSLHQVDISPVGKWLSRLISSRRPTGDAAFDGRFIVTQDGLPAREGWLNEATRREIERFFDGVPLPGLIWIREGELQFIMQDPWKGLDGPAVRGLLERQSALAAALEHTAGASRVPTSSP